MAQRGTLAVEPRTILGKKVKQLRRAGKTPATIYGPGMESKAVQVDTHDLILLLRTVGEGDTVQVNLDNKRQRLVVQAVQWNPLTGLPEHVDFYQGRS
jgi:large subunit ribosomal protein L25